jgi:hypothetical protein
LPDPPVVLPARELARGRPRQFAAQRGPVRGRRLVRDDQRQRVGVRRRCGIRRAGVQRARQHDAGGDGAAECSNRFVDGRSDMYGDTFMFAYLDALKPDRDAFERLVAQYRIRWALLATHSAVAQMVATLPGWRRIHADDVAVVFVRDGP